MPLFVEIHERIIHEPLLKLSDPFLNEVKTMDSYKMPDLKSNAKKDWSKVEAKISAISAFKDAINV